MNMIGQAVSPEEALVADEVLEVAGLGQPPSWEEELIASEITEVTGGELGVVGAVASVGMKAAMPSIQKGLTGLLAGKGAKEARRNRTGAQNQLVALKKIAEALADGTDELMTLRAQGQRIDSFQVTEADVAHQQAMRAWSVSAGSYASLAGTELGQVPATEEVERLFLQGVLGQVFVPGRTGAERLRLRRAPVSPYYQETPLRTGLERLRANVRSRSLLGQVPATEEVERLFLQGYDIDLGRSRAQKTAARLGWLKTYQGEFMAAMKKANNNLNALAAATGVVRATPGEAMEAVGVPPARPPEIPEPPAIPVPAPPPGAPLTRPPMPSFPTTAPPGAGPGWFPKKKIPVGLLVGGGVGAAALIGVLALVGLKLMRPRMSGLGAFVQ